MARLPVRVLSIAPKYVFLLASCLSTSLRPLSVWKEHNKFWQRHPIHRVAQRSSIFSIHSSMFISSFTGSNACSTFSISLKDLPLSSSGILSLLSCTFSVERLSYEISSLSLSFLSPFQQVSALSLSASLSGPSSTPFKFRKFPLLPETEASLSLFEASLLDFSISSLISLPLSWFVKFPSTLFSLSSESLPAKKS